jgi:hypothetical protein
LLQSSGLGTGDDARLRHSFQRLHLKRRKIKKLLLAIETKMIIINRNLRHINKFLKNCK